jgi:hypothetical protein
VERSRPNGRRATASQIRAIETIADRQHLDLLATAAFGAPATIRCTLRGWPRSPSPRPTDHAGGLRRQRAVGEGCGRGA